MVAKFVLAAFGCFFILQIHYACCEADQSATNQVQTVQQGVTEGNFKNPVANEAIHTILRHFRILMTHEVSASMIRYITTTIRLLFTSPVGQQNIQHLITFMVDVLKDPNTYDVVTTLHLKLLQLAKSSRTAPNVLETASVAVKKILDEPKLLEATEGFVEGFNLMLDNMTEEKLREGLKRLQKLQKFAGVFKPLMKNKIPKVTQLESSKSNIVPIEGVDNNSGIENTVYVRELPWINGKPEYPVVNDVGKRSAIGDI